jgi:hypothetical protein
MIRRILSRIWSAVAAFARWYWRRVKEVPLVVASFALGGAYVAVLMTVPSLAHAVLERGL